MPATTVARTGVTATDTSFALVTVSFALPVAPAAAVAITVPDPTLSEVTSPEVLTVASAVLDVLHATTGGASTHFVPSLKTAVAVYCCVVPAGSDFVAGVTDTDLIVAVSTVIVAVPTTAAGADAPVVALIVAVPGATATTSPALVTVATAVLLEAHVTVLVRFLVVLLSYEPVATSACVVLAGSVVVPGVTAIEVRVARTVTFAVPLIVPLVAVSVADPGPTVVTSPAALTVATAALLVVHVAVLVRSCVVALLYVPTASSCCVTPA